MSDYIETRVNQSMASILARSPEWVWAVPSRMVYRTALVGPVFMGRYVSTECAPRRRIRLADMFGQMMDLSFPGQRGTATQISIYDQEQGGNMLFFHDGFRYFGPGDTIRFGWMLS